MPAKHEFLSEPIFLARHAPQSQAAAVSEAAEDDGYLATYLSNGRDMKSELLLFDARDISRGPLQRIPLPVYLSGGLHGSFVDGLVFNDDDISRKFKVDSFQ
jgi:carotenoid cleavage dioxygenase-like enzyme